MCIRQDFFKKKKKKKKKKKNGEIITKELMKEETIPPPPRPPSQKSITPKHPYLDTRLLGRGNERIKNLKTGKNILL